MQLTSAPRRRLELVEGSAVALCAVLLLALTARLSGAPWSPAAVIAVAGGLAAGYLAADLASGLVHWFCDRFFEEDSPLIGVVLIHPFREHHRDPLAMTPAPSIRWRSSASSSISCWWPPSAWACSAWS